MAKDKQQKIFTSNLNYYLQKVDKTQREVANKVGVSPQTFNTWCQGIAIPRMGKIQALADYFKIKKSDLIEEHDPDKQIQLEISASMSEILNLLLSSLEQLNEEGQEKIIEYASDLVASGKYKKHGEFELDKEA